MPTRDDILEELGLTPVYRAKKSAAKAAEKSAAIPKKNLTKNAEIAPQVLTKKATRPEPQAVMRGAALAATPVATAANAPSNDDRAARIAQLDWDALVADIAQCRACGLCQTRLNTVPGVGARTASWMVVGEAPGEEEDKQGEPFVGRAGKLLDQMLKAVQRTRASNVYIANTLKCRPPGNRNPSPEELAACAPYIERQIALMQPKMILAVGKFAAQIVTGSEESIGAMRAKTYHFHGIPVRVTYHPAYLLRSPGEKAKVWDDLLAAKKLFGD